MRHTKWIDQCGKQLAQKAEYPTDSDLVAYLDVQLLVRKAQIVLDDRLDDHMDYSHLSTWRAVFELMKKQETKDSLMPCPGSNDNCKQWLLNSYLIYTSDSS